jgi:tRNA dimethylallyltransferase
MTKPVVVALIGPTATGKSELALRLCETTGAEIVACDSMQVYRGLDIGTAKPTLKERSRVPHHLVDVAAPNEQFSAGRYVLLADEALASLARRGRPALIVGGTGLYLRALRFGLITAPPRDEALRAQLYAEERADPGRLHRLLVEVDPESARRLAPADLVRVVRALEVQRLTGRTLHAYHEAHERRPRVPMAVFVLDPAIEVLRSRISARVAAMLSGGLIEEVKRVLQLYGAAAPVLTAVGYRQVVAHLQGALSSADLPSAIERATLAYARRQRTWFKKELDVTRHETAVALEPVALAALGRSAL